MKKKVIIISIVILFYIGIFLLIPYLFSMQYNVNGISHFLIIHIDTSIPKTYIGKLDNYKVYIEELDINNTYFRTIDAENISIEDVINKKISTVDEWRKYAWFKFKQKNTEILRYENYEIAISKDELIIRPISNNKSLDITCNVNDKYRITLKKGNTFDCRLLSTDYTFKIKNISKNNIVITTNNYGLTKVKDKGINLRTKEKEFIIEKNKDVELTTQTMDYNESIILKWK